ncbi:MAG: LysR family transcriptional regulator [Actinomycetota bacterium]|nr:LysR family transcriptional regulator [Actinomycetota bacterium]
MLDVRRLQVLRAVVEEGSVTAAAAVLGYSPSAVSQSLAALEREAKMPLFEKAGRGLRPTEAGLLLAERAGAVRDQLVEAEAALQALRAGDAGHLRLAAFATAGAALVPRALAEFRNEHPGVELDLSIAETDDALAHLRSAKIDLAVIAEHSTVSDDPEDGLTYVGLLDDPYRVVLPRNHPAAARRTVALEDLADEPWIATASARCNCLQTVTTACARAGFVPHFAIEADEFATTIGFVTAGLGVAMVPMLALSSLPDTVVSRRIRAHEPLRHVYAGFRRARAGHPLVSTMLAALQVSAGSYLKAVA